MARQIETNFVMRQIPTPAANASGYLSFYPKSDDNFYLRTSAGVERRLATSTDLGNYLPLTGGTVTGDLSLDGNILSKYASGWAGLSPATILPIQNVLAFADRNPDISISLSLPTYQSYTIDRALDGNSITYARWINASALIVEFDVTTRRNAQSLFGIGFSSNSYAYSNVKIEAYDDYNSIWKTIFETTTNTNDAVLISKYINYITKVRFSISDPVKTGLRINAFIFANDGDRSGYYFNRGGDTLFGQLNSVVPTGTAPFVIASTTLNTNLNADLLDGYHASSFALASHTHSNYISGSGTANYLPKLTAALTLANSIIFEEDGMVGIGTDSPNYELQVNGEIRAKNLSIAEGDSIATLSPTLLTMGDGFNYIVTFRASPTDIQISGNDMSNWTAFPISIGSVWGGLGNGRYIKIDDTTDTFTINFSKVKLQLGTANAFVKTDANKEFVYDTGLYTKVSNFDNYRIPFGTATAGTFDCTSKFQYISSGGGMLKMQSESGSDFPTFWLHNRDANLNGALLQLESGTGSTYVAANKVLGDFRFLSSGNYAAGMWAKATALHTDTTSPTRLGFYNVGETANSVLYERMTINPNGSVQINAGQQIVSPFMFRVSSNATTDAFEVTPDKVYSKNKIETADLFTAGGLNGMSGSSIILTGCTYNSGTRTLLFTRASLTVTGGIITQVTSESSLSVPLI